MLTDNFHTINQPVTGEYKEKGSSFIAYAFRVDDESQVSAYIESIKDEHPKARHYCYAWKLGTDNNRFRANDDGEPSGTAGKPILNQIMSHGLTNVLVVVVRYFGGTKLGVPGLIKAYKEATETALGKAEIIEDYITETFKLKFTYGELGHIMDILKNSEIEVLSTSFTEFPSAVIKIRLNNVSQTLLKLKAAILRKSVEEMALIREMENISIERIS